ncbi:MAG: phosphate ABC transporter ATP-binding protein [Actinobacteria bacterium]|nr:phosphate ABC transporter ATP-binding protein [Actinomycetota bacterium]MCA1739606.1 phosphate ABC transporter ATP-binding protein [Actinomycetota bacterium]
MGLKVRASRLWYAAGGVEILKDINVGAQEGAITAVVGPSGAGKSTLLRAINRLIEPTAGEVYLDGSPTSGMDPLALRRRVGMVFQLPALFGASVEDELLYGPHLAGRSTDVGRLLEMVGLDGSFEDRDPRTLSVGQQQRVSIARSLALEPEVLLMDEPTSALDEAARRHIEELIRELNARLDLTIVLVSHALDQVERVADRVVLLAAGRSEGEWSKEEFFSGEGGEQAKRFISGGF